MVLLQLFPSQIPDLVSDSQLVISGRCRGSFPNFLKAKGMLGNSKDLIVNLKVINTTEIPLIRVRYQGQSLFKPASLYFLASILTFFFFFFFFWGLHDR